MPQPDRNSTPSKAATLSSGELSRQANVTRGVLRTYESLGLIEATRTSSGYRRFPASTVDRLAMIQTAKAMGLTLAEARELLPLLDPGRHARPRLLAAVRKHHAALGDRIEHLVAIREVLSSLLAAPEKLIVDYGLVNFSVGVDGIDISADGQWLYFASMSHARLYRVPLAALLDAAPDDALAARIEDLGPKPLSDGIAFDREGRLLITDVENGGLMRRDAAGQLQTLVKSGQVIWADGVAVAPDGAVVFTDSAIPAYIDALAQPPSMERLATGRPYRLWRVRAP